MTCSVTSSYVTLFGRRTHMSRKHFMSFATSTQRNDKKLSAHNRGLRLVPTSFWPVTDVYDTSLSSFGASRRPDSAFADALFDTIIQFALPRERVVKSTLLVNSR